MTEKELAQGLARSDLAEFDKAMRTVRYPRGHVLYTPETEGQALFILGHGRVNVYRLTQDGRKLVTATMEPGTIFGMRWLTKPGSESFAEVVEDATLCVLTLPDLEQLVGAHPRLALRLIRALVAQLEEAETRLVNFALRGVRSRLAATLLRLAGETEETVSGLTHQELADLVGASRETVTRILDEFYEQGIVDPRRRRIRILNADGLRKQLDT